MIRCWACHRPLKTSESIHRGIGPTCEAKRNPYQAHQEPPTRPQVVIPHPRAPRHNSPPPGLLMGQLALFDDTGEQLE